jgi:hypothetical protein
MRGWPPLQLVLVIAGLALVAVPLTHLTTARVAPPPPPVTSASDGSAIPAFVRVRFAHLPDRVALSAADQQWLDDQSPALFIEQRRPVVIDDGNLELSVQVEWPEGTPATPVTIEIEPDGLEARSQTRWGDQQIDEMLSFAWK